MTFNNSKKQPYLFKFKKENINNMTYAEHCFKQKLDILNIKYMAQKGFMNDKSFYLIDFYLPKPYKLCIEIDGEYHNTKIQKKNDAIKDHYLTSIRGFKILRFTNSTALSISIPDLKTIIGSYL